MRARVTTFADAMASQIVPVIAQAIVPVQAIVQEIGWVTAAAIERPASAIAVQITVTSEGQAQAHVMSAAVAVMSAVADVTSAADAPAPAVWTAVAVAILAVAVVTVLQAARRSAVAQARVRAAAAAAARPAWRVRAGAVAERVLAVAGAAEVGDDKPLAHASIANRRETGDDQPYPLSIQTCVAERRVRALHSRHS